MGEPTHRLRPTHHRMWVMHHLVQATLMGILLTRATPHLLKDTRHPPRATPLLCKVVINQLWATRLRKGMFRSCQWLQGHLSHSRQ